MKRARPGLLLLAVSSCGMLGGIDDKVFVDDPADSAGSANAGGSAETGGSGTGNSAGTGGLAGVGGAPGGFAGIDSMAAGAGGSDGTGGSNDPTGGSGGDPGEPCADVTAELCMQPPWPEGVIPYRSAPDVPGFVRSSVRSAIFIWDGLAAGGARLDFIDLDSPFGDEPAPENVPVLVYAMGKGCGPVARTDQEVIVELGGCSEQWELLHVVGVALGLPRYHQRADRDRYLELAPASAFDCEKAQSRAICPTVDGAPAQLGTFDYSKSLMLPVGRVPGAPWVPENCGLEPNGRYLFLPRGPWQELYFACSALESRSPYRTDVEASQIAELYAVAYGWSPFLPVGADLGPEQRIRVSLGEGAEFTNTPVLATGDGKGPVAFVEGVTSDQVPGLWMIENDGEAWGEWTRILEDVPQAVYPGSFVSRRPQASDIFDFFSMSFDELLHWAYDRELASTESSSFALPEGTSPSALAIATGPSSTFVYVAVTPEDDFALNRVYVSEFDGEWSAWQLLPELEEPQFLRGMAVTASADGQHHVMTLTSIGYQYATHAGGEWSAWSTLSDAQTLSGLKELRDHILVSTNEHPLVLIGTAFDPAGGTTLLWAVTCEQLPCSELDAWSEPLPLGSVPGSFGAVAPNAERIDVIAMFSEYRPAEGEQAYGMWHKRWRSPPPAE